MNSSAEPISKAVRPLTHYALLSLAVAGGTFLMKLVAWRLTGSVGLLSDALESLANIAAALVAYAALAVAMRPADEDHAFGHSKAEYIAAAVEGLLILLTAAAIGWAALERFFRPQALTAPVAGIAVSTAASVLSFVVARILIKVGQARHSITLQAEATNLMADVWTSVVVIAAVALVALTGWWWIDPLLGLLLAFHIIVMGLKLVKQSAYGLMDTGLEAADLKVIRRLLASYAAKGVDTHALRTRQAAALKFISVHLLMPGAWSIKQGNALAERLEQDLRNAVPGLVVFTHLEPKEDPLSWKDGGLDRTSVHSLSPALPTDHPMRSA
jgi:cation diffusion facilitator family transporter